MLPDELNITIDSLIGRNDTTRDMIEAVKKFDAGDHYMLTLCGGVGLGKSAALMALCNEQNKRKYGSAYYVRLVDLMNIIRAGYKDDSSDMRYNRLIKIPMLAIDEVDKARMSEWADEFRTLFFDDRYRYAKNRMCKTALAMNGDANELPNHIYDRLRYGEREPDGFRIIRVTGASARPSGM